jgi:hypothetical protein
MLGVRHGIPPEPEHSEASLVSLVGPLPSIGASAGVQLTFVWSPEPPQHPTCAPRVAARVIQISSVAGLAAHPGALLYHASKWGVEGFIEALAGEVAPFGIGVTLVEPGGARTAFSRGSLRLGTPLDAYAGTPAAPVHTFKDTDLPVLGDPAKIAARVIDSAEQEPAAPGAGQRLVPGRRRRAAQPPRPDRAPAASPSGRARARPASEFSPGSPPGRAPPRRSTLVRTSGSPRPRPSGTGASGSANAPGSSAGSRPAGAGSSTAPRSPR